MSRTTMSSMCSIGVLVQRNDTGTWNARLPAIGLLLLGRWKVAPSLAVLQLSPHTSMSSLSLTVDPLARQSIAVHRHGGWRSMRTLVLFLVAPV